LAIEKVQSIAKPVDREKIILDHYKWLLDWAHQLTRGSKEEAEDLVQDVYVRFVQASTEIDLQDPDRIKGYLYTTIRNLAASKALRQGRDVLSNLQVIDFDSVEFALTSVDRSRLLLVRSDLASICEYACLRRKTSHAASVLILRFFCGYYPSEIVKLIHSTPAAVNKLIENARLEAKAYLTRPGSLTFIEQPIRTTTASRSLPDHPTELFIELRRRIFAYPEGDCFPPKELRERYVAGAEPKRFSKREFAHLVSCSTCLDEANETLGLDKLAKRFPLGGDAPEGRNGPPAPPQGGGDKALGLRRKLKQTFEHRPAKLEVSVNGEVRGAQLITSSRSKFQIKLRPLSEPQFVELLSEQGVRLLYLELDANDVSVASPKHTETELSDHRHLSLDVATRAGARVIEVSYYDPTLEESADSLPGDLAEPPAIRPEDASIAVETRESLLARMRARVSRWLSEHHWQWPMSFMIASAVVFLLLGFTILKSRKAVIETYLSGPALLAKSTEGSDSAVPLHGAVHRTFTLDVRSDKGKLLSSTKVETLKSLAPRRSALRLTTPDGKFLAGSWIDASGKETTYTAERGLKSSAKAVPASKTTFDDAWMHPPEADDFAAVTGNAQTLDVRREGNAYEVSYYSAESPNAPTVASAELTLAADSMRPIAETLRVRDHKEIRQYQFKELTYEVLQPAQLRDSDFEPDTQLVSLRSGITAGPGLRNAHLALDALQLLSNLGSDVEQLVELDRLPDGSVQISGVLPTSEQKASIEHVFDSLREEGQLTLALHSNDEAPTKPAARRTAKVEELAPVAVDNERIPFDPEIRTALTAKGVPDAEMNGRVSQMASEMLTHAARMHREAWIIWQISTKDFSRSDLQSMQSPDRILWLTLLDKHIRTLDEELANVTGDLKSVLQDETVHSPPTPNVNFNSAPNNLSDLGKVAEVLNTDGERLDRLLTAGLTLSPQSLPSNHNVANIAELLTDLRSRESMLHATVERLQALGQPELTK
jgi:RNA polymerase sigma factor (sigma-70 family)